MTLSQESQVGNQAHKRFSGYLIWPAILGLSLAIPIAPESRLTFFDVLSIAICVQGIEFIRRSRQAMNLLLLYFIYIVFMVISFLLHDLPIINLVRRLFTISILLINILALYNFSFRSSELQLTVLLFTMMIGISFHYFYPVDQRITELPIKFLIGMPVGVIIILLCMSFPIQDINKRLLVTICLFIYSIYCADVGSRSQAGVFFICGIFVWLKNKISFKPIYRYVFPIFLLLGLIAGWALTEAYAYVAIRGYFGERAAGIAEFQESFFGSILLGGRPEIYINLLATYDSPFFGHGPLSEGTEYRGILELLNVYSFEDISSRGEELLYHSMVFGAGHEAGIFAMMFWLYLVYRISYSASILVNLKGRIAFAALSIMIGGIWDLLFSPLIPTNRPLLALAVALAFLIADWRQGKHCKSMRESWLDNSVGQNRLIFE